MGDKILKKLLLLTAFTVLLVQATVESKIESKISTNNEVNVQKYDTIFEQISKKRVGPSDKELSRLTTPFVDRTVLKIIKDKNATKPKPIVLKLYGIFDDKANINKKWYKIRSKVYSYRLVKIKNSSVILKRKRKKLELFLRKKNDKIQITKNF